MRTCTTHHAPRMAVTVRAAPRATTLRSGPHHRLLSSLPPRNTPPRLFGQPKPLPPSSISPDTKPAPPMGPQASTKANPNDARYARSLNDRAKTLLRSDQSESTLNTFDEMLRRGAFNPSPQTWAAAITAAQKTSRIDKAMEYWQMLVTATPPFGTKIAMPPLPLPPLLYDAIIRALCKSHRVEKAEEIFQHMLTQCAEPPPERTVSALVYGLASSLRGKAAFDLLHAHSNPPSPALYSALFLGLQAANAVAEANEYFTQTTVPLEERSIGALLDMNERNFEMASRIWQTYVNSKPVKGPSSAALHSLILRACTHTRLGAPLIREVLERVRKEQIELTPQLYIAMMNAHTKLQDPVGAVRIWEEVRRTGVPLEKPLFTQGLFVLNRAGRADEAAALLEDPALFRLVDLHAIDTVIFGALRIGREEAALRAYAQIEKHKLKPGLHTLSPMVQYYCAADRAPEAHRFYTEMSRLGLKPDLAVLNALLEMCARLGLDESMLRLYRHALAEASPSQARYE